MGVEILDRFLEVATKAARRGGDIAFERREPGHVGMDRKADETPVTETDKEIERAIAEIIRGQFSSHRFFGEESGELNPDSNSEYQWGVDPIDGTWAFVNGENTPCVNIVLLQGRTPIVAVINNPFTRELFSVSKGTATNMNNRPLPLTKWPNLREGVLNFGNTRRSLEFVFALYEGFKRNKIGKMLSMGGAPSYAMAQVAKGAHSAFVTAAWKERIDIADLTSGVLLVEGAGGQVTDQNGNSIAPLEHRGLLIATTVEQVHDDVLALLREHLK